MTENLFSSFDISGQGMSVQRLRLSAVARNIANVNTTRGIDGQPYQREVVVVRDIKNSPFQKQVKAQLELMKTNESHTFSANANGLAPKAEVLNARVVRDNAGPRLEYNPGHPDADLNGYVKMPNINVVTEMVEMIAAQRAFQANGSVVDAAKNIARYSLDI